MQAVTEYKNGSIDTRIFNNIRAHDAVGEILNDDGPENPAVRIWIVMDEVGETWDEAQAPYWTAHEAHYVYIRRMTDKRLGRLSLDHTGLDAWCEICKQYPKSDPLLDEDVIQWIEDDDDRSGIFDDEVAVVFTPDDDEELARWLQEGGE